MQSRQTLFRVLLGLGHPQTVWHACLVALAGIAALGVLMDLSNTAKFGQIDLRNRVVGARVMMLGENPYTFLWQPGDSDTLLDPYPVLQRRARSATTVSPTVLSVHALFAGLPYRYQKSIWLIVQLALFGGMVWLAMRRALNTETRAVVLLLGLMFSCSTFWRLHVERGQTYVLFAFLAVLYISSFQWRSAQRSVVGGFILGLLVCLRPHMVLLGVPLLLYRRWTGILGAIAGVGIGLLLPTLISRAVWPEYVESMVTYIPDVPGQNDPRRPLAAIADMPAEVEGSANLGAYSAFNVVDTTVRGAARLYLSRYVSASFPLLSGLLLVGTIAWFLNVFRLMRRGVPIDYSSAMTVGLVLFAETMLPMIRIEYSNMILLPIILMVVAIRSQLSTMRTWEWALIAAAWLFSAPFPPWVSAGYRGSGLAMISQCAILLWVACVSWRPLLSPQADPESPSPQAVAAR
jgi:hypothetical protein